MGEVQLERVHRVGTLLRGRDGEPPKSRTIVARFCRYSDRQLALRISPKLKSTNIYLNEDLCKASVHERKAQLPELCKARAEGKIAYFSCTKLVVKERRERSGPLSVSTGSRPKTAVSAPALAAGISSSSPSAAVTLGEFLTAAGGGGAVGGSGPGREERPRRAKYK